ncbi:MAG: class I SAM-dependent methyltransferase [bacterium]
MKVDWEREKSWWDAKAPKEEEDLGDELVNRALRWREIEQHLDGIKTILDVGCGQGRFAIPLAKRGFAVTCIDISPVILDIARNKAKGLKNITFIEGNVIDLSQFAEKSFDLVLAMDGAISFCGPEAEKAVHESCRVTKRKLIMTVLSRARMVQLCVESSLELSGKLLKAVYEFMDTGLWHQNQFPENKIFTKGLTQDYLGTIKAFTLPELKIIIEQANMHILRLGAFGSLSNTFKKEMIEKISQNKVLLKEFIDLADRFDKEILPEGVGPRQRCGLIAVTGPKS